MIEYITLIFILLAFEYAYFILAKRLRIVDRPQHQSSHKGVIVRGGGILFYVAFVLWSLSHGLRWGGGLLGLTILAGVSFIDDIHSVSPKIRLVCQFIAIFVICRFAVFHVCFCRMVYGGLSEIQAVPPFY